MTQYRVSRLVIGRRTEPGFPPYPKARAPGAGGTRSPGPADAPATVEFDDVSFGYDEGRPVLDG
ncbi:hypothetical protein AB0F45_38990, partial [Streptomyces achromogenes]|uniref:hypothetical protein n=1 Tax=Streptomyces achromogenes TaxID=67255 RepID=UPI0033E431F5